MIIFGRYPEPGNVKTRLIPALGAAGAADLQRHLTERTLKTARKAAAKLPGSNVEICFEGDSEKRFHRWLGKGISLSRQDSGNLGERMYVAFLQAFRKGCERVVLFGTDIPGFGSRHLEETFYALREKDLVLGPSMDGGYWLMGLKNPVDLFSGIEWGTNRVLDQTVAAANKLGLKIHQLNPLNDIDTVKDLEQGILQWGKKPYLSVIIPTLNESVNIEATLKGAENQDSEIIVCDGGSGDKTREMAKEAGARIISSPKSRSLQQNEGARAAKGRVVLFLHADTLLPENYIYNIFETLMDPETILGAFRFKTDLNGIGIRIIELLTQFRSQCLNLPYGDQGLFMRKELFDSTNGFPEVSIAEDLFFVRDLSKRGKISIAPASVIASGRRWQKMGILRTTLINQIIVAGCLMGVSPDRLAPLYRHNSG